MHARVFVPHCVGGTVVEGVAAQLPPSATDAVAVIARPDTLTHVVGAIVAHFPGVSIVEKQGVALQVGVPTIASVENVTALAVH